MLTLQEIIDRSPEPEYTDTWSPVPHREIDEQVRVALGDEFEFGRAVYSASKDYGTMWCRQELWHPQYFDFSPTIVWRNSVTKRASFAINIGVTNPVCTNLELPGDFIAFRKHTGRFGDDYIPIIREAIGTIHESAHEVVSRLHRFEKLQVSVQLARSIAYSAAVKGILSIGRLREFDKLYFEDDNQYGNTLFGVNGAFTEIFSKMPYTQRAEQLHRDTGELMNRVADYLEA